MKIVIDARVLTGKMHGIARYTYNLIAYLAKQDYHNNYTILYNRYCPQDIICNNPKFKHLYFPAKLYSLAEQYYLPRLLRKLNPDIYHSPTFSAPVIQPCKVLMTIYDIIHLTHSGGFSPAYYFYYSLIVKKAALRCAGIITVTNHSRLEINRHLGIPLDKICVNYGGIDLKLFSSNKSSTIEIPEQFDLLPGYLLFVGNHKPHKNVNFLIKAYTRSKKVSPSLPCLVLVGVSPEYLKNNFDKSESQDIKVISSTSDEDLIALYKNASLLIAPSLQEGFGLPMLEAAACGVPVIVSDIPVMREVLGDAGLFIDPYSLPQLEKAITDLSKDDRLNQSLIEKGLKRAMLFKWEETANKTLSIYNKITSKIDSMRG